jgi:hypothetical protein
VSKKDDKKESTAEAKSAKKGGTPSVASFLSKISTPRGQAGSASPAKGLLGDITRDDIAGIGRDGHNPPPSDDVVVREVSDAVPVAPATMSIELSSQLSADNRKGDRIPAVHTVDVRGVFTSTVMAADGAPKTRDMSAGGVFVETAHLLEVGDPVVLSFPQADGKRLVVNGRVRWVTPFGRLEDPVPGMGIEFVGLDQNKLERLDTVLRSARS